ncbi:MAG: stage II sporulation protein M [Candidatus Diapherotrites archaeon]|nr:stage II sporulation protein M [Candidatus Diapherotrites archaeon]
MVLESVLGERVVRKHPLFILFMAVVISVGSLICANAFFPAYSSVLSIAFITIGFAPLIHRILLHEESEEALTKKSCVTFFARHFNLIMIYVWLFVGIILTFSIVYLVIPQEQSKSIFSEQMKTFCAISGKCEGGNPFSMVAGESEKAGTVTGKATALAMEECKNSETKNLASCAAYIFENNSGVLVFTLILSLFYGAGAIFLIAWNASVLGIFFGEMIASGAIVQGLGMLESMLIGHGPPELLGYIFGALAGAIISAMVAKGKFLTHEFELIFKDFIFLTGLAFFSVFYGAIMEALIMTESNSVLYYGMGFVYMVTVILLVVLYGRKSSSDVCDTDLF